ncbi:hypothetical protein MAQ5080_00929 [Marinomonas aquimarina]|uniref:Uncharacterized protein n=1 Tax=Marinomonas aquimarina TaxID=295068 RepID=A0A1A8T8J3_9GAMM|nr:hypothetical protein [Marinomonas aquimarina]SBS27856.1 hypothetical protein MAQ5080_00929 [Marinomonas aquimarina]
MIFIDTVNRITHLPEREAPTHFRRRRSRTDKDSLTLSEAAAHVQQITLSYENASNLTPTDSIIANMLEAVLQQLDDLNIHVEALSQIAPANNSWQLTLQTPPLSQADTGPSYASNVKELQKDKPFKRIELHLIGEDKTNKLCQLTFIQHHLSAPLQQALVQLPPKQTLHMPYSAHELELLPLHWVFEIDQDGEAEPLASLYETSTFKPADYTAQFNSLQIWFERQEDALPLLISDRRLGYVYLGNYEAYTSEEHAPEAGNITSGTLDTNA